MAKHKTTVFAVGLVVNPNCPWLGATPDGKVWDSSVFENVGLLEIKCPHKYQSVTPQEAATMSDFCCELVDGNISLKQNHEYYSQVQGQMAVCNIKWCDFVIYTSKGISVQRIIFDEDFWLHDLYPKLTDIYFKHGVDFLSQ